MPQLAALEHALTLNQNELGPRANPRVEPRPMPEPMERRALKIAKLV